MKRIIYKDTNGILKIIIPSDKYADKIEELVDRLVPENAEYNIVEHTDIPSDRTFRNAWDLDSNDNIIVDRAKAEVIHTNRLRKLRADQLEKLDKEYLKADEQADNAKKNEIATLKQQLRDFPTDFDLSGFTLEELKSAKPTFMDGDILQHANSFYKSV